MKQNTKKPKLTKEMREKLDNKVVLATAVALVSAMIMLFLYNWFVSIYAAQTKVLIEVLMWLGIAGVAAFLVLYFVKKDKRFLYVLPYFAVGAFFMYEILKGTVTGFFTMLLSKIPFLHVSEYATTAARFDFVYICLGIYLIVSYILYAVRLKKFAK